MSENISGKVILITGASSGLGEAAARHLAKEGATVVLGARRIDRLKTLEAEINKEGKALALQVDVTDAEQLKKMADTAFKQFGRIDVLINNAGLMPQSLIENFRIDEWNQMIDVNIKGVLYGIAAVMPYMIEQKSGHIINVSSVAGHKVHPGGAVYSATKHAVRVISEGFRQEVKHYNIRTTVISPGMVDTELPDSVKEPHFSMRMHKLYKDFAVPSDSFARAVAFAISQPENIDINEILYRPTRQDF